MHTYKLSTIAILALIFCFLVIPPNASADQRPNILAERISAAKKMGVIPVETPVPDRYHQIKPWASLSKEDRQRETKAMEVYAGMVSNMDYHFGRVIQFLKDIGKYENTIVLFLSDNGPNPWYSGDYPGNAGSEWFSQFDNSTENIGHPMSHYAYGMGWSSVSAGPLDLFKMTVGEGGIRSPLLVSGPRIKSGVQNDSFAYVWDIMPTILDLTGISHPDQFNDRKVERRAARHGGDQCIRSYKLSQVHLSSR